MKLLSLARSSCLVLLLSCILAPPFGICETRVGLECARADDESTSLLQISAQNLHSRRIQHNLSSGKNFVTSFVGNDERIELLPRASHEGVYQKGFRLLSASSVFSCLQASPHSVSAPGNVQVANCSSRNGIEAQFWKMPVTGKHAVKGRRLIKIPLENSPTSCLGVKTTCSATGSHCQRNVGMYACNAVDSVVIWTWGDPENERTELFLKHMGTGDCLQFSAGNLQKPKPPELVKCPKGDSVKPFQWLALPAARLVPVTELPLRVVGGSVLGSSGRTVKLRGVNWYGATLRQHVNNGLDKVTLEEMGRLLVNMGFNMVRMPWGTQQFLENPIVNKSFVAANPELKGKRSVEVFDACVKALTSAGLLVILNNHVTLDKWCCTPWDGNALWFNPTWHEKLWFEYLRKVSSRYKANKRVIGMDLRNEPRPEIQLNDSDALYMLWWGNDFLGRNGTAINWRAGATEGSKAVWHGNAEALVFVEGTEAVDVRNVLGNRMSFNQSCLHSRVAYSIHDYPWFAFWLETLGSENLSKKMPALETLEMIAKVIIHDATSDSGSYKEFSASREKLWGRFARNHTAPIWIGEFGDSKRSKWWRYFVRYISDLNVDWSYWAVDGYKYPAWAKNNAAAVEEPEGLLTEDFLSIRHPWILHDLAPMIYTSGVQQTTKKYPGTCDFNAALNPVHGTGEYNFTSPLQTVVSELAVEAGLHANQLSQIPKNVSDAIGKLAQYLKKIAK